MLFRQWRMGPMQNFVYLFARGGEGFVVDPAWEAPRLLREAEALGVRITHVLVTHGHPDHVNGVEAVRRATGAKVLAHESADHPLDLKLADGQVVDVAGLRIEVVHTPGHRFDSACYVVEGTHVLTGDTLFVGECGRVDLPGSDVRAMHHSLTQKVARLPGGLIVCPGHDYGPAPLSTIADETRSNYTLKPRTVEEFERFMREP
jgi:glyoxylase-like metal-dependent hydrolase (beta-lactamase superfamily II)